MTEQDIREILRAYIDDVHNGVAREFSREHGISAVYVCQVLRGVAKPGEKILDAIGYEKQISYVPMEK